MKKIYAYFLLLFILSIISTSVIEADESFDVKVKVLNDDEPLYNVFVSIGNESSLTNDNGIARLSVPGGTYTLSIISVDFGKIIDEVIIISDDYYEVDFSYTDTVNEESDSFTVNPYIIFVILLVIIFAILIGSPTQTNFIKKYQESPWTYIAAGIVLFIVIYVLTINGGL